MKKRGRISLLLTVMALFGSTQTSISSEKLRSTIPMENKGAGTYYVDVHLEGLGVADFLVDTGSTYTAINEKTLAALKRQGTVTYVKDLAGVMADGRHKIVPVYRLSALRIGKDCFIDNVEIAVFPGESRSILGLNALGKAAPFVFSTLPPSLVLSRCSSRTKA